MNWIAFAGLDEYFDDRDDDDDDDHRYNGVQYITPIADLGLHHDVNFWLSDCRKESEFVWVPLMNAMMIKRENEVSENYCILLRVMYKI